MYTQELLFEFPPSFSPVSSESLQLLFLLYADPIQARFGASGHVLRAWT